MNVPMLQQLAFDVQSHRGPSSGRRVWYRVAGTACRCLMAALRGFQQFGSRRVLSPERPDTYRGIHHGIIPSPMAELSPSGRLSGVPDRVARRPGLLTVVDDSTLRWLWGTGSCSICVTSARRESVTRSGCWTSNGVARRERRLGH